MLLDASSRSEPEGVCPRSRDEGAPGVRSASQMQALAAPCRCSLPLRCKLASFLRVGLRS